MNEWKSVGRRKFYKKSNFGSWSVSSLYADFGKRPNHFCDSGFCSFCWGRVTRLAGWAGWLSLLSACAAFWDVNKVTMVGDVGDGCHCEAVKQLSSKEGAARMAQPRS